MRTVSAIKNINSTLIVYGLNMVLQFIIRFVLLYYLSIEYLGLNGLFDNILTVLSLTELGIGPAIIFSLYSPLANHDLETVKSIMRIFKKAYIYIGTLILFLGLCISPFVQHLIKVPPNIAYLNIFFLLFVVDTGISYFYSYKKCLLIADQKQYIANYYRGITQLIGSLFQIALVVLTHSFWVYIILRICMTFSENFLIARKADHLYSFLNEKNIQPLNKDIYQNIIRNIKALILHKIGGVTVFGTSNIILSKFVGLSAVALYTNYYLIINGIDKLSDQVFNALKASVGNLNESHDDAHKLVIFKRLEFMTAYLACFICSNLYLLLNPFITIWLGSSYRFDESIVLWMVINFYLMFMRKGVLVFKDAMGLFWQNRYMSLIEALINLGSSIVLVQYFDVWGVLLAMFISTICMPFIVEPYVLFKYGLRWSLVSYFKLYFRYTLVTFILVYFSKFLSQFIALDSGWFGLLLGVVCNSIFIIVAWGILFIRSKELRFYLDLIKSRL